MRPRGATAGRLQPVVTFLAGLAVGWVAFSPRGTPAPVHLNTHQAGKQAGAGEPRLKTGDFSAADPGTQLLSAPRAGYGLQDAAASAAAVLDPALVLQALHDQSERAQQQFCDEHPDLSQGAEGLVRVIGHAPPPLDTANTYPIWVHANNDFVSRSIQEHGYWEEKDTLEMLRLMDEFRQKHDLAQREVVLLDIGANVGWYAVTAAAFGHTVVAFEPMERNLGAVRRTLCENPQLRERITLVTLGLSSKPQMCSFYVDSTNLGNGYTGCGADAHNATMAGKVKVGEFELTTLDNVLAAAAPALAGKLGVLKIDVEGFEPQVYAGGKEFMSQVHPEQIFAEINGPALRAASGATPEDMFKIYSDWGFDLRWKDGFQGEPEPPASFSQLGVQSKASMQATNFYLSRTPGAELAAQ